MSTTGAGPKANRWTPEERDRGLTATAMLNGNTRRAAAELKKQGLSIPRSTLEAWMNRTAKDRYLEVQRKVLPGLRARMAEQNEALATQYVHAEHEAVGLLVERLGRAKLVEWECSHPGCFYATKTRETFICPEHPNAAPRERATIDAKDLSAIAKNIGIPKGIAVDKSLILRGDPTQITEHRDIDATKAGLKRMGLMPRSVKAEDVVIDAEVVPESIASASE